MASASFKHRTVSDAEEVGQRQDQSTYSVEVWRANDVQPIWHYVNVGDLDYDSDAGVVSFTKANGKLVVVHGPAICVIEEE